MKKTGIRIRAMRAKDMPAALELWKATKGVGVGKTDTPARLKLFLRLHPGVSSVACDGESLVGAVLCGDEGRRGYIHHLAVAPAYRKRGLGRALVERCIFRLRRKGILKCNGFLFAPNVSGRRFWLRIGWNLRRDLIVIQRETGPERGRRRVHG